MFLPNPYDALLPAPYSHLALATLEVQVVGTNIIDDGTGLTGRVSLTSQTVTGSPTSYSWTEGTTVLGTDPSLSVDLPIGLHTIVLTVTDGSGNRFVDTALVAAGYTQPARLSRDRL